MAFQPAVGAQLTVDGTVYTVADQPAAPGIPYGQEGRQVVVYQLLTNGKPHWFY